MGYIVFLRQIFYFYIFIIIVRKIIFDFFGETCVNQFGGSGGSNITEKTGLLVL